VLLPRTEVVEASRRGLGAAVAVLLVDAQGSMRRRQ
jgi:Mg-chelatase subunit ChlD